MFNKNLEKEIKIPRRSIFRRKIKSNKIFIGKPEFKHTSDKVIVTLYVYNRELILLNKKLKNIRRKLLAEYLFKIIVNNKIIFNKITYIKTILLKLDNILFNLNKLNSKKYNNYLNTKNIVSKYIYILQELANKWNIYNNMKENTLKSKVIITKAIKYVELILNKGKTINVTKVNNRSNSVKKPIKKGTHKILKYIHILISKDLSSKLHKYINTYLNKKYNFKYNKLMYFNILKKTVFKMKLYLRYLKFIHFNKMKFNLYILSLKPFFTKILKKNVEFNIVNLKNYNLDSNILTEIMATKLKNRKNKIMKITDKVLTNIKLPLTKRLDYVKEISHNKSLQNFNIKSFIGLNQYKVLPNNNLLSYSNIYNNIYMYKLDTDKLDGILKYLYIREYNVNKSNKNYITKRSIENTVLDLVKHKTITGIKIEGSGRLTKRLVAARSVSIVKQKGTIRNINSSYKKLPTVLFRNNLKSNVQYTQTNNKTRIGAFGLKGWISSI